MSIGGGIKNPTNPTNPNNSVSMGGSESSEQSQSSSWQDPASVWGGQAGYLTNLFGAGQNLMQNFNPYQQQGQGVFEQALAGFDRLMNPGVNPQLQAYSGEVQRNLERNLLPAVGGQAAGFGQRGSSRQGVAEGLAVSDANQQITDMASNLYNADMNRVQAAMQFAPQLGAFGMGIPWFGMQQMKGLLGDPTVLAGGGGSASSGSGGSSSWNVGRDIGGGGGGGGGGWDFEIGPGKTVPLPGVK